jgi:hypothetical protein
LEFAHDVGVGGGDVAGFERIVGVVEQLDLRGAVVGARDDEAPAVGADRATGILPKGAGGFCGRRGRAVELRAQAAAVELGRGGQATEIGERGKDIDGLDEGGARGPGLGESGGANQER